MTQPERDPEITAHGHEARTMVNGIIDQCRDIFKPKNVEVYRWYRRGEDEVVFVFMREPNIALDSTVIVLDPDDAREMLQILEWIGEEEPNDQA